jgi:tetratricopeptide (TPR) repeat protein
MHIKASVRSITKISTLRASARIAVLTVIALSASSSGWTQACSIPLAFEKKLSVHPNADTYSVLGEWFNENHQPQCALDAFQSALKLDPSSKKALDGLAKGLIAAGDYGAVISHLSSVQRDENLTLDLATAYREAELFDDAERILTDAVKSNPNSDELTSALVSLDIHVSHFSAAEVLAGKLATRKPRDIEAQRVYLRTLVINGENDKAILLAHKLLTLAPHDPDFLYQSGLLEREAGDYAQARKHLEESIALNPNFYNSHYNLGLVLAQLQEAAGASEQFRKAIDLGGTEPAIRFDLAKALRTLGQTDEAQQQLQLYQQRLKEEANHSLAVLKSTQAEEAVKAGDNQKAADLFREASQALPDNPALAYRLAIVLGVLGDLPGERAALEQAIKADAEFPLAHYQLGYLELHDEHLAVAEDQFRLAVKASPNYTQAWVALAATLGMESHLQDAIDAIASALKIDPNNKAALDLQQKLTVAQGQPQ